MKQKQCRIKSEPVIVKTTYPILYIVLVAVLLLSPIVEQTVIAREVFVQNGFEKESLGKPPKDWDVRGKGFEVTDDEVKTDKRALAILQGANDDRVGVAIETENPIITAEFWVYIKSGGRSFNFRIVTSENHAQNNGSVYINWDANAVRLFNGAAWQPIDDFETNKWRYVRVVADVSKNKFDFYAGEDRNEALRDKGKKGLPFRNAAEFPVPKWVSFHVYSIDAPGYVDDLLVYEGDEPLNLAVEPTEKLTTVWGHLKGHFTLQ